MKAMIVAKLQAGETIENYKEGGNSMTPLIKSREPITLAPPDKTMLAPRDIVFCKVAGNYYTHLITAVKPGQVQISNNHGHVNGWTTLDKVYGIVTHISGKEISGAMEKVLRPIDEETSRLLDEALKAVDKRKELSDEEWAMSLAKDIVQI